ncbi:MYG1 protein isoform X2 [Coccinella septempunctata]|uniref:MYG1 protein isoform X2 n=1 Tax=Coccinella septempunctata TaxID=41139 RepID=UPI001D06210C|nr:MYG1 protein isoform X2 [Coccinella septempunctata]
MAVALRNSLIQKSSSLVKVLDDVWQGIMATNEKCLKMSKKIGTHSGVFHCDEVLACFMLKQLPLYRDADIIRTRDEAILSTCDIVVDVGAVYDPSTHRFDHHQRSFNETLSSVRPDLVKNKFIKLSSAGLIYAHYGLEVIAEICKTKDICLDSASLKCLFTYIYDIFVEEMDAIDNGVPMYPEGKPLYRINTNLSSRVGKMNLKWNEPEKLSSIDSLFHKAMSYVGAEFQQCVLEAATDWWPAREIVRKSIKQRKEIHPSGEIFILEDRCPWKDHLYAIEEELGIEGELKFVVFHDMSGSWRVQGIPVQPDSFICRVFLHRSWRGVRDQDLSDVAGIKDCVFCHSTGFIGGNQTKEGAIEMALKSLNAATIDKE